MLAGLGKERKNIHFLYFPLLTSSPSQAARGQTVLLCYSWIDFDVWCLKCSKMFQKKMGGGDEMAAGEREVQREKTIKWEINEGILQKKTWVKCLKLHLLPHLCTLREKWIFCLISGMRPFFLRISGWLVSIEFFF